MNPLLADVLEMLKLERLEDNLFRGQSRDPGGKRVFGGQVLGQALRAATATVTADRVVHSLHAYFLRAGDPEHPIVYDVDRSRDGASFSSRRVVAIQHGVQIFHMSASFHVQEEGVDRQAPMPEVPEPDSLADLGTVIRQFADKTPDAPKTFANHARPFDFRPVGWDGPGAAVPVVPQVRMWFKAIEPLPDDPELHRALLAYASDYFLLGTAAFDERMIFGRRDIQVASIDHAMWFHRPARMDEWLLYAMESPTAMSSRGLARGSIYTRDGILVASTIQEGLVRRKAPKEAS
jgi:acyl-CoA thioesterase II